MKRLGGGREGGFEYWRLVEAQDKRSHKCSNPVSSKPHKKALVSELYTVYKPVRIIVFILQHVPYCGISYKQ